MDKFNDWAELTVASVAAGSLVFAELGPHLTPKDDSSRRVMLSPPEASHLNHTDPELPHQPGSPWAPAVAVSTSTATGLLVTLPVPA
jgi:hypothetical protein